MKDENSLATEFLQRHPVEATRLLEQLPAEDVAALLGSLTSERTVPLLMAMLPEPAALVLKTMEPASAAALLSKLTPIHGGRLYRLLGGERQQALSEHLDKNTLRRLRHYASYAALSVGDLMEPHVIMLPVSIHVAEALRRIERIEQTIPCDVYVVDDNHKLVGQIELGRLLTTDHRIRLGEMMNTHVQPLAVQAGVESLLAHPAWQRSRRLPVVERDDTLVGVLEYSRVLELIEEGRHERHEERGGLASLLGLYWLTVVQLLESLFSLAGADKGEKS